MQTNNLTGEEIPESSLELLIKYAKDQLALETRIERGEKVMTELKAQLQQLRTKTIPDLMTELGIDEFKLNTGEKITIKPFYTASVVNMTTFYEWLKEHGHEHILKVDVLVPVGKGQVEKAEKIQKKILGSGITCNVVTTIHPQTLKAFVKERIEAGEDIPVECARTYVGKQTNIK